MARDMTTIGVRVDDETLQRIDANAEHFDCSRSAMVRALIDTGLHSTLPNQPQDYERMDAVELRRRGELVTG